MIFLEAMSRFKTFYESEPQFLNTFQNRMIHSNTFVSSVVNNEDFERQSELEKKLKYNELYTRIKIS